METSDGPENIDMERISSGVKGLDDMIEGGYLKGRSVMIYGGPGVGKTIMSLHYIHNACKSGHKCLFLASEEEPAEIMLQAKLLGLDLDEFEENGLLKIIPSLSDRMGDVQWQRGRTKGSSIFKRPIEDIRNSDADIVVIDNIGTYALDVTIGKFREQIDFLIHRIREKGMTSLIVCDETIDERYNSVALYAVHGAVHMQKRENPFTGNMERVMDVVKMRGTKTPLEFVKYDIDGHGININKPQK